MLIHMLCCGFQLGGMEFEAGMTLVGLLSPMDVEIKLFQNPMIASLGAHLNINVNLKTRSMG